MDQEFGERLAAEYRNARERMSELVSNIANGNESRPVLACPAWNVRDLLSHVTGIAHDLSAGNSPAGDTQAWVDAQVEQRRSRSVHSVLDEWNDVAPAFESMIATLPKQLWGLTYDVVVHEHDLRNALGNRDERDSAGVSFAAELGLKLVKMDLPKTGLASFRSVIDGHEHVVGTGEPQLTLTATSFETLRTLGSRRTLAEMRRANFEGDLESYLASITHMNLPSESLGEME